MGSFTSIVVGPRYGGNRLLQSEPVGYRGKQISLGQNLELLMKTGDSTYGSSVPSGKNRAAFGLGAASFNLWEFNPKTRGQSRLES